MPSDYENIRDDNIRRRGEEFDDIGKLISEQLYSDRAHFIYELLQNAEDALERRLKLAPKHNLRSVKFLLFKDKLEFRHFGQLFDENDVRGITDVLKGTKDKDSAQIGKFGIGFKSVYAFTTTPEIHSGEEHFVIERYIRPRATHPFGEMVEGETLFIFPFNHEKLSANEAFDIISAKLKGLGTSVLLFLNCIDEIEWCIDETHVRGQYIKESKVRHNAKQVTLIGQHNAQEEDENWLVFGKSLPIPDGSNKVNVEIGFRLETDSKNQIESIIKVRNSPLFVYFPTEKETRFGFLIQGPYRTTPSRDNILDYDKRNKDLVKETAVLITEALEHLKEMGMLTVSLLEALTIGMEDFSEDSIFYPIVEAVYNAIMNEELLPANDETFITAGNARLARGTDLRELLSHDQLRQLFQSKHEIKWLSGEITVDRTPDLHNYLTNKLNVEEVTPEGFARRVSEEFLANQSDDWFVRFYVYLLEQEALWGSPRWAGDTRRGILRNKPILRLQNNELVTPFRFDGTPSAYLPPMEETDLPIVKREFVDNEQVVKFLNRLGLSEPDLFDDIVERVLPKYTHKNASSITIDEHKMDIRKIFRAMLSDSEIGKEKVKTSAENTPFICSADNAGNLSYQKPVDVYMNDEDLRLYFSCSKEAWFLNEIYMNWQLDPEVWVNLGVAYLPRRIQFSGGLPIGLKEHSTRPENIVNYDLDGLEEFLAKMAEVPDFDSGKKRSFVLCKYLSKYLEDDPRFFYGKYQWFYYNPQSKYFDSSMLTLLRESIWIPTLNQKLEKPSDISVSQLCEDFAGSDELINILGIENDLNSDLITEEQVREKYAIELGITIDDVEFLKNHQEEFGRWKISIINKNDKSTFPVRPVADPGRRRERITEQLINAPKKEDEIHEISVRSTSGTIDPQTGLKHLYTNEVGQMICQICEEEMPFKKRDDEYYFEAVEALTRDHFPKEHESQFLALCPLCAAMYKEFIKRDEGAMKAFKDALMSSDEPEVSVRLGNKNAKVKFVETHFQDIKAALDFYNLKLNNTQ